MSVYRNASLDERVGLHREPSAPTRRSGPDRARGSTRVHVCSRCDTETVGTTGLSRTPSNIAIQSQRQCDGAHALTQCRLQLAHAMLTTSHYILELPRQCRSQPTVHSPRERDGKPRAHTDIPAPPHKNRVGLRTCLYFGSSIPCHIPMAPTSLLLHILKEISASSRTRVSLA